MADPSIQLTVVTPDRAVVQEETQEIHVPGSRGYLGILPGHAPLFSELRVGEVSYRMGSRWTYMAVAWGFVEVLANQVRVLAECAELAHEIDIERAARAKRRAEELLSSTGEEIDYDRALVALERALVRIQVSQKINGR